MPIQFQQPYDRRELKKFLENDFLPDDFESAEENISIEFPTQYIQKAVYLGESPSLKLKVFKINHHSENDPRVGISKELFRTMRQYGYRRALVLLHSSKSSNYRLSLATIEFKLDGSKVNKEYSNPRRYSFFLGPDCKNHTPDEFLVKKGRVKDFDDLKSRFSIEVVNKEFYNAIALLFTELVGGERKIGSKTIKKRGWLKLPGKDDHVKKQEFAVRLIGRLVFCWFLKKKRSAEGKPLISDQILSGDTVPARFYHDVLENLFFQALNTPMDKRLPEFQKDPWKDVPFLNGGLFEPHDDDHYKGKPLYSLEIKDSWFEELFKVFETYNFTIDENTSVDVELSVEPEMLGRIFENLLAEINPETGESARKSTGSFYTPRPIVEYMVDESIKQYLHTHTGVSLERLAGLLSYNDDTHDLNEKEKQSVMQALSKIKILDPACGSGAFPMGCLQKILLILQKLDPEAQQSLNKVLADTRDATVREMLRRKLQGDKDLWNYTRKLSVIRDSIYGVDIQPIAVEISKLRFFLSLVVDEKINENEDNRGIEPLPNLEFKFVCANTLIGLPPINEQMDAFEESAHVQKLKDLRDEYFTSYGDQKKNIEKEIDLLQKEMAKDSVKNKEARAVKLANWKPFSDEASSWFDPEWMFGLKDGFDIVIANPPYLEISGIDWNLRRVYETLFKTAKGRFDLYILFIEKAMKLKKLDGSFSYIVPGKFLNNKQFVVARQLICENYSVTIVKIDDRVFEASVNSAIVQNYFAGNVAKAKYKVFKISGQEVTLLSETTVQNIVENPEIVFRVEFDDNVDKLISKIKENTKIFKEIGEVKDGIVAGTIKDILFVNKKIDKNCKELFFGKHLSRYHLNNTDTWINYRPSEMMKAEIRRQKGKRPGLWMRNENVFKRSKIIYRKVATELVATYDGVGVYYEQTIHGATVVDNNVQTKFVLALFNSFLFKFYYHMTNSQGGNIFPQVRISSVENLPIKIVAKTIQGKIVGIVERILTAKQTNPQADTTKLEREIDVMVYKLYELTYDEVKIVDPEFWLSRAEYEKFEIKDA